MGKSGESTRPADLEYGDSLGAPGPAMLSVTLPRCGLDPWGRGRLPQRRDKAAAALQNPERRMETRVGRSARRPGAGSFRGGQEAGVAARPPGERKGRRSRGRVPLSVSQRLHKEGFQALMGLALGVRPRRGFCIVSGGQS